MASLNGVSLKKLQKMRGREGIAFSADIYIDGKKAGFVEDDGNGGSLCIHGYEGGDREFDKVLDERAKAYFAKHPTVMSVRHDGGHDEDLINELFHLVETETYFKKMAKKGYAAVVEVSYRTPEISDTVSDITVNSTARGKDLALLLKAAMAKPDRMYAVPKWDAKEEASLRKEAGDPPVMKVYQKPEDFEVTV